MRISDALRIEKGGKEELTVDAIAAGTFAMIDITGLRLRSMKTYCKGTIMSDAIPKSRHSKEANGTHRCNQICEKRNDEENQSVAKDESHQS